MMKIRSICDEGSESDMRDEEFDENVLDEGYDDFEEDE